MVWINLGCLCIAGVLAIPVLVFCFECLAALLPGADRATHLSPSEPAATPRPPVAVLIPAHNEELDLGATLASLQPQLHAGDRIVVVADNCNDRTADIGRERGAEVLERTDAQRRGKGYALEFGVAHLARGGSPPPLVVVLDADCTMLPGAIDALARAAQSSGRPAQGLYLLDQPPARSAAAGDLVSALAFLVKNHVRPRGLRRFNLPCPLTGSGMAFPLPLLAGSALGGGSIVEDMQLGLDLAIAGSPAAFCEPARILGRLPGDRHAVKTQRTRWEHGHLDTAIKQVPRLLWSGIRRGRLATVVLALDLCVPPLSLLAMLLMCATAIMLIPARLGHRAAGLELMLGQDVLLFVCLAAAWTRFGRRALPLGSMMSAPAYVLRKAPLYGSFVFRRQRTWVRTPRSAVPATESRGNAATTTALRSLATAPHGGGCSKSSDRS